MTVGGVRGGEKGVVRLGRCGLRDVSETPTMVIREGDDGGEV